ncbi:MAG: DUF86 domain-containing protein [Bacteroidetes bacterium]|nr:DUF86 domain-containing protein [Bacteroidota bacterium]
MKDDMIYIEHILDAINQILLYTEQVERDDFLNDRMRQDAVIRQFEIMGEATKNISSDFTEQYPSIEWRYMAKMRDRLIHNYFGVDKRIVWETVKSDLPRLHKEITKLLPGQL